MTYNSDLSLPPEKKQSMHAKGHLTESKGRKTHIKLRR